jgi:hypothetical protein
VKWIGLILATTLLTVFARLLPGWLAVACAGGLLWGSVAVVHEGWRTQFAQLDVLRGIEPAPIPPRRRAGAGRQARSA